MKSEGEGRSEGMSEGMKKGGEGGRRKEEGEVRVRKRAVQTRTE